MATATQAMPGHGLELAKDHAALALRTDAARLKARLEQLQTDYDALVRSRLDYDPGTVSVCGVAESIRALEEHFGELPDVRNDAIEATRRRVTHIIEAAQDKHDPLFGRLSPWQIDDLKTLTNQ